MDLIKEMGRSCLKYAIFSFTSGHCDNSVAHEVFSVLEAGALKHPGVDQDVEEHCLHAVQHLKKNGIDEDGFSDKAHALARLLLALHRAVRQ